MSADRYLIAPPDGSAEDLRPLLVAALAAAPAAALLLPRGTRDDAAYAALVSALAPLAQAEDCAVLVEGSPRLVSALKVDGLHVTGDIAAARAAVEALKPQAIVGVGGLEGRHEAMTAGELGVDYILFGPLSGAITAAERELARWWAETMEIPSVLSDPARAPAEIDDEGCEFVGLGLGKAGEQS